MSDQIPDYTGKMRTLGNSVYRVKHVNWALDENGSYKVGTLVRPISGVNNSDEPGYHFDPAYMTVCRYGNTMAQFVGFSIKDELEYVCEVTDDTAMYFALEAWFLLLIPG